ncbi:MAG: putative Fe-S protein YdhL (DUF1289 family) [Gammaproteobacteria bacterium]|jgi:predicted Fe-S protein YdhL (DUF1289 family)
MKQRTDIQQRSATSDSPCVQVCRLHPDGSYCLGCFRTVEEIGAWGTYSDSDRDVVLRELDTRRAHRREQRRKNRPSLSHGSCSPEQGPKQGHSS